MADPQNPVINQSGAASITSGQFCTWNTALGSGSTLTIANSSRSNKLTFVVSGAPASGITVLVNDVIQTTPINSAYSIPPNTPSYTLIGTGDFSGTVVTITNITNAQNDATATIQAQTTKS